MNDLDPRLGPGGNNPPPDLKVGPELRAQLEREQVELVARTNEMLEMGRAFADDHPAIESDEVSGELAGVIRQILAHAKSVDQVRVGVKDPWLAGTRIVDAFFGEQASPLQSIASDLNKMQTAYLRAKEERKRREAAEAAERARREEETRRREAEKAEQERRRAERAAAKPPSAPLLDGPKVIQPDQAAIAADAAQRAADARAAQERAQVEREIQHEIATAPAADLARTRGEYAMATLRTRWVYEVEDITKIPAEYLAVNDRLVKAAIAGPQGKRDIPGLKIFSERTAQNR